MTLTSKTELNLLVRERNTLAIYWKRMHIGRVSQDRSKITKRWFFIDILNTNSQSFCQLEECASLKGVSPIISNILIKWFFIVIKKPIFRLYVIVLKRFYYTKTHVFPINTLISRVFVILDWHFCKSYVNQWGDRRNFKSIYLQLKIVPLCDMASDRKVCF